MNALNLNKPDGIFCTCHQSKKQCTTFVILHKISSLPSATFLIRTYKPPSQIFQITDFQCLQNKNRNTKRRHMLQHLQRDQHRPAFPVLGPCRSPPLLTLLKSYYDLLSKSWAHPVLGNRNETQSLFNFKNNPPETYMT